MAPFFALLAAATASDPMRARGKCNPEFADADWRTLRNITLVPDWRVLPGDIADANKTLDGMYHEIVCRLAAADGPLTLFVVGDSTMATQLAHIHYAIRWEVERQSLAGTAKLMTSCTTPCSELAPNSTSFGDISNLNLDECFLEPGEAIDHGLYQDNGSAPGPRIEALAVGNAELAGSPYNTAGSLVSAGVLEIGRLAATIGGKAISVVSVISRRCAMGVRRLLDNPAPARVRQPQPPSRRSVMTMSQAASMLDVLRSPPYNFEELEGRPLLAYVQAFGMHHMHSGNYVDFEHKAPLAAVPGYRARLQAGLEALDRRAAPGSTIVLMTTHTICETDEVARYKRECARSTEACERVCKEATPDDQKPFATPICSFGSSNGTTDPRMVQLYAHSLSSKTGSNRLAWNERDVLVQHPSLAGLLDAHNMTLDKCNHSSDGRHYDITVVHAEVVELLSRFQLLPRPRGASQQLEAVPPICVAGDMQLGEEELKVAAAAPIALSTQSAQTRCLRFADHDFNRWFAKNSAPSGRNATEADCSHACSDASSEHHTWCVGFEFRGTEKGTCELYDSCSHAAPPAAVRCLRVADHDFDKWFVEKNGRKATEADCSLACNNASSVAGEAAKKVVGEAAKEWCVGFEFRRTETGMCELYDNCSQQQSRQQQATTMAEEQLKMASAAARDRSDLGDLGLAARAATAEERLKAVASMVRAFSAATPDMPAADEQLRAAAEAVQVLRASALEASPEATPIAQQAADEQAAEEARDVAETAAENQSEPARQSVASASPTPSPDAVGAPADQEALNRSPPTGTPQRLAPKGWRDASSIWSPDGHWTLDDAEALRIDAEALRTISTEQLGNAETEEANFEAWENAPRPWEETSTQSRAMAVSARQLLPLHRPTIHEEDPAQEQAHFEAWEDAPRPWDPEREQDPVPASSAKAALAEHEPGTALPAVLTSRPSGWTLDPRVYEELGQFTGCPDGQRNAAESECLAAVQEATHALGLLLQAPHLIKVVDAGADGWVPGGCSYSRGHGQRALFNRNPAGRSTGSYPLVCIEDGAQVPAADGNPPQRQASQRGKRQQRTRAAPRRPCARCPSRLTRQSTLLSFAPQLGRRLLVIIPTTRTWHTGT